MPTCNVDICEDTLTFRFGEPANNDRIVVEVSEQIDRLIENKQICGGKLLKITGKQSVPVAFAICHKVAHLYSAIAVCDPKMGSGGMDAYIVVISHSPDYQVGQILNNSKDLDVPLVKIALCGPSHSGKSCLGEGLKIAIRQLTGDTPYILTACPDGEGAWFYQAYSLNPERTTELKKMNQSEFTAAHAELAASWVRGLSISALIDCGGRISPENDQILAEATHAIVLAGDALDEHGQPIADTYQARLQEWVDYCEKMGLKVIAKIYSDYHGKADRVDPQSSPLTGAIHNLSRGDETVNDRLMVKALANLVVNLPGFIGN